MFVFPKKTMSKLLTIITTTYNAAEHIQEYLVAFKKLDHSKFDWIVVDAASNDGTLEVLNRNKSIFNYFISEKDEGFYYGLNKAITATKTPYYLVFGADDTPSENILELILPRLAKNPCLLLGAVYLDNANKIKRPKPIWKKYLSWGHVISHHSVGTVIAKSMHDKYGLYDTKYKIFADGAFLMNVLDNEINIEKTNEVFGCFASGGISDNTSLETIIELFKIQILSEKNKLIQVLLLLKRLYDLKPIKRKTR